MAGAPPLAIWRRNWPDYALEGLLLGCFLVTACLVVALLQHPGSPVRNALPDGTVRRAVIGAAMGLTALLILTSRIGKRTGAHINPAVTLVFLWQGKTTPADAAGYIAGQTAGAVLGVSATALALGGVVRHPSVNYVVTVPGADGPLVAWLVEFALSAGMILTVLSVSSAPRLARFTAHFAALLVFLYISLAAPYSGMSINPARTLGSAIPANVFTALWVYLTAPVAGFFAGAALHRVLARCAHERACCMGGKCVSCRCVFTCHKKAFGPESAPRTGGANPRPMDSREALS
ncbi:MAG: aquaporin [Candidatus Sumerlaeia bacterium]|nr:aquaporin [Candidatus Sumerlaeia bacterium]